MEMVFRGQKVPTYRWVSDTWVDVKHCMCISSEKIMRVAPKVYVRQSVCVWVGGGGGRGGGEGEGKGGRRQRGAEVSHSQQAGVVNQGLCHLKRVMKMVSRKQKVPTYRWVGPTVWVGGILGRGREEGGGGGAWGCQPGAVPPETSDGNGVQGAEGAHIQVLCVLGGGGGGYVWSSSEYGVYN